MIYAYAYIKHPNKLRTQSDRKPFDSTNSVYSKKKKNISYAKGVYFMFTIFAPLELQRHARYMLSFHINN